MVLGYLTCGAHTQDFLQAMLLTQPPMSIACVAWCHGEPLFPFGKEMHLQEMIRSLDAVDSRQPHLLHQTILESFKQSLDAPFRLWTVCRDPFDPQLFQSPPELRACSFSSELFRQRCRHTCPVFTRCERGRHKAALVIHFRSVSRLTRNPSLARCSAASVGPKSA